MFLFLTVLIFSRLVNAWCVSQQLQIQKLRPYLWLMGQVWYENAKIWKLIFFKVAWPKVAPWHNLLYTLPTLAPTKFKSRPPEISSCKPGSNNIEFWKAIVILGPAYHKQYMNVSLVNKDDQGRKSVKFHNSHAMAKQFGLIKPKASTSATFFQKKNIFDDVMIRRPKWLLESNSRWAKCGIIKKLHFFFLSLASLFHIVDFL